MSCGVGCRGCLDPDLLWLWLRPIAAALIQPLALELPYATRAALKRKKKTKKLELKLENREWYCNHTRRGVTMPLEPGVPLGPS